MTRSVLLPHTVAVVPHVVDAAPRRSSPSATGQRSANEGCATPLTVTGIASTAGGFAATVLDTTHCTVVTRDTSCCASHAPKTSKPVRPPRTPLESIVIGALSTKATFSLCSQATVITSSPVAPASMVRSVTGATAVSNAESSETVMSEVKLTRVPSWCVGAVLGAAVGTCVGTDMLGAAVGAALGTNVLGAAVGTDVLGAAVGAAVGSDVLGAAVGAAVGSDVLGAAVGTDVLGAAVGACVGTCVGACVGAVQNWT